LGASGIVSVMTSSAELPSNVPNRRLEIRGVSKSFDGEGVLSDVSLNVAPSEIVALLGPSGCGKTTLLRTIAGLERPDAGTVEIGDTVVTGPNVFVKPERRRLGMVFQDWALFPHLSVGQNVGYGLPRANRRSGRVEEVLDMVGLGGFADREPATLSGGQQQRVALARALAPSPSVLLLDEPFSNLDSALRVEVRSEVHRLLLDLGITAVFVTHDQEEAFVLGGRVAVMNNGAIEQIDPPDALYQRPATRWIASFVGNVNLVRASATGTQVRTPFGEVTLQRAASGEVDVLLRPEDLVITGDGASPGSADAHGAGGANGDGSQAGGGAPATVDLIEYYGHDVMVSVRTGDGEMVWVRTPPGVRWSRGDVVAVSYRGGATVAFPLTN
jgi:iron(III) transport system ATP-binding protein